MSPSSVRMSLSSAVAAVAALTLALVGVAGLDAQQPTGRIVGRVIDAQSGQGLPYAGIQVVGTTLGAQSQVEGRFAIPGIPAGTVSIQIRLIGYAPKTITGVVVSPNGAIEQNVTLEPATVQLQAQVVTASVERGTVSQALDLQRNALAIVSSVSSEQIARSPDSDAAQAVQRVSGVTVQDGKYVFVRGLGERYTTTSLNGARLPSPEPERKVIPLDLFPAGLLQTITTSKTFTPDQPGDFSGALVDIRTREFPARRQFTYGMTTGYNDAATGRTVLASPTAGREWLALGGSQRSLHPLVQEASVQFGDLPQSELNRVARMFRNAWTPLERTGAPNTSFSASVGGSDPVLGQRFGYLLSGTFSNTQEVRRAEVRANALPGDGGVAEISDRFTGETGRTSVLWGGLANLSTNLGAHSRIALNGTYNRTADNEARTERGFSENLSTDLEIMRLRYIERSVHSAQLTGEHTLGSRHDASWSFTASGVSRKEPDRSEFVYNLGDEMTGSPRGGWFAMSNEGAVRTFGNLAESNIEGAAAYRMTLGTAGRQHSVKVGGLFRSTDRDADNQSYSIRGLGIDSDLRGRTAENIMATLTQPEALGLRLTSLSQGGSYDATDRLAAGFAMADLVLSQRFRLIGGARIERSDVTVNAQPTFGEMVTSRPSHTDVLPSAALNVSLTGTQTVRVSVSQTLSRPEYREIAPIGYYDVLGGDIVVGNENLRRATIQNADVRWEYYPNSGEILSVAVFAKRFQDPIERIYLATSGTRYVSFANAQRAENYGIEFEARKSLQELAGALSPFTVFMNVTLMQSDITIGGGEASRTNDKRAMVGQAPYVVNAGATYSSETGGTSATLLYNVVGRRIHSAAEAPLPDVYEESRHVVDFSLRFPVWRSVSGRFDARNMLDSPYELRQGAVVREAYRAGRVLQMGLTWRP